MSEKKFLLDFEIEAEGCLCEGLGTIKTKHPEEFYEVQITNLQVQPGVDRPLLSLQIILPGEDINSIEEIGIQTAKEYLTYLSFVTNMSFKIHKLNRIVDWTKGLTQRGCIQLNLFPGTELPHAIIEEKHIHSIEKLLQVKASLPFKRAMKWFSNGIGATSLDDQFQYFWLTIELLSQVNKDSSKVNDLCPKCHSPLFCQACGDYALHKPYPKQSIKKLIDGITAFNTEGFFEVSNEIRNAIMHGKDVNESCSKLNVEMAHIVDVLGKIAWIAILDMFKSDLTENFGVVTLDLMNVNKYSNHMLQVKINLVLSCKDPDNPQLSDLGKFDVSVSYPEKETHDRHGELL